MLRIATWRIVQFSTSFSLFGVSHHLKLVIVGLTTDPKRLMQVRKTRLQHLSDSTNPNYADIDIITNEVREARKLFNRHNWPVMDVSRRSVEEIAASIIHLHRKWLDQQELDQQQNV